MSALGQSLINHIRKNFTLLSFFLEGLHYFHKKKKKKAVNKINYFIIFSKNIFKNDS